MGTNHHHNTTTTPSERPSSTAAAAAAAARQDGWAAREADDGGARRTSHTSGGTSSALPRGSAMSQYSQHGTQDRPSQRPHHRRGNGDGSRGSPPLGSADHPWGGGGGADDGRARGPARGDGAAAGGVCTPGPDERARPLSGTQRRREREGFGDGDRGKRRDEPGREPGGCGGDGDALSDTGPDGEGGRWVAFDVCHRVRGQAYMEVMINVSSAR